MPRPPSEMLTERESQIMDALWQLGEATAEQVRARLPGAPHDSSVRTMLRVLRDKGYVRAVPDSRPIRYQAAVPQAHVRRSAMRSLLRRFFSGSPEQLLVQLLEDEQLTAEQLAKLRRQLSASSRRRKEGSR